MDPRTRFQELIALPDNQIPLAEAALWIAAEAKPNIDVAYWLDEIRSLSDRIRPHMESVPSRRRQVEILNHCLFKQEGFCGNTADYTNPQNSFLDSVLESRQGIPITLSIIYIEVANLLDLDSAGVGFPGHFLVKVEADGADIIVDSFFGCILSEDDCQERLEKVAGSQALLQPQMLETTSRREILQRVLRNLKLLYMGEKQYESALSCSERILLLAGDDMSELRDRGLIYRELECVGPAVEDLQRYLAFNPSDPNSQTIAEVIRDLRERTQRLH